VTSEIGDTWIQGIASDPLKCAEYRAVSRVMRDCLAVGKEIYYSFFLHDSVCVSFIYLYVCGCNGACICVCPNCIGKGKVPIVNSALSQLCDLRVWCSSPFPIALSQQ